MEHDTELREHVLRVIVVDDEAIARRRLARLLATERDVQVVAQCPGGRTAIERIREEAPDVVFLDVQMPDLNAFEVIEAIGVENMPAIVFVTAYDDYAVRAFEVHAVDYLLKPYDEARFRSALARVRARLRATASEAPVVDERVRTLLGALITDAARDATRIGSATADVEPDAPFEHVAVRVGGSTRLIRAADVDWIETAGNYLRLHVGKASYLLRQTAERIEELLGPRRFVRIHRRYIVNVARIAEVQPWFGGDAIVVLHDGTKVRLSRSYRDHFNRHLLVDRSEAGGAARSRHSAR